MGRLEDGLEKLHAFVPLEDVDVFCVMNSGRCYGDQVSRRLGLDDWCRFFPAHLRIDTEGEEYLTPHAKKYWVEHNRELPPVPYDQFLCDPALRIVGSWDPSHAAVIVDDFRFTGRVFEHAWTSLMMLGYAPENVCLFEGYKGRANHPASEWDWSSKGI